MSKKRGLAKGLNELLQVALDKDLLDPKPTTTENKTKQSTAEAQMNADVLVAEKPAAALNNENQNRPGESIHYLPVSKIGKSPFQPRREFDEDLLAELANSIKVQGVIQPIVVRSLENNRYELVAGERRWRAAQLAGLDKIPALVRTLSDESAMTVALIENIQREDLNPIDEARAIKRIVDQWGLTHVEAAEAIGKSRTAVTNLLRLLSLNDDVKQMLETGDLEMGHARALLALSGKMQSEMARAVVARSLNVRETEQLIQRIKNKANKTITEQTTDPDVLRLQEDLSHKLGAKVAIKCKANGRGYVVINYHSLDELDGILAHIQ